MYKALLLTALVFPSLSFAQNFIPEASAVAAVGESFLIISDEEPTSIWITESTLNPRMVTATGGKWDDMEALAGIDSGSFMGLTSHSLTKKGKRRPERELLIQFSKNKDSIRIEKTWTLRDQILNYLEAKLSSELDMKKVREEGPETGGLNIEGLALIGDTLYAGLRSPVTKNGEAIILTLSNLKAPTLSGHRLVKLDGNGIRSLETSGNDLIVLSGSTDDTDKAFFLKRHNVSTNVTSNVAYEGFRNLLRPEGIALAKDGSMIFVQDFKEPGTQNVIVRLNVTAH